MIDRLAAGVAIARRDGSIEHANRYLHEVLDAHDVSPLDLPLECHEDGSAMVGPAGRTARGAPRWDFRTVRVRSRSGKAVEFLQAAYPLHDSSGAATHFLHLLQVLGGEKGFEALSRLAFYDSLTGLPNRNLFNDRLEHGIASAQRHGGALALLCIDIDHFKRVNDAFGHEAGDELLREVAARLARTVRSSDTVARWGGDEFVAILDGVGDRASAAAIAAKMLSACDSAYSVCGRDCRITLSIGASIYPRDGKDTAALFERADRAMYEAKARGRAGYHILEQARCSYSGAA